MHIPLNNRAIFWLTAVFMLGLFTGCFVSENSQTVKRLTFLLCQAQADREALEDGNRALLGGMSNKMSVGGANTVSTLMPDEKDK